MYTLSGFCSFKNNYISSQNEVTDIVNSMTNINDTTINDHKSIFLNENVVLIYQSPEHLHQPITSNCDKYTIIFNGELYNKKELLQIIEDNNYKLNSKNDIDIVLALYILFQENSLTLINGIFAFSIWDNIKKRLFLARDKFGVKPLFYTILDDTLVVSSSLNSILNYPLVEPIIDKDGLCELLGLFPSRSEGFGVFKGIKEVKFASYGIYDASGYTEKTYWKLESKKNDMTYKEILKKTRDLVTDAIIRQIESNKTISTFLSGGIDSSIVTAVIANELKKNGKVLDTYSFDYEDNAKYFISNDFQSDTDRKWVEKVVEHLDTNHTFLECNIENLVKYLYYAVDAKDYPGMADIDSSLLYFCDEVCKKHLLAVSGECSDEVFGGYPWFHDEESLYKNTFPWIRDFDSRKMLIKDNILSKLDIEGYVQEKYNESIKNVPILETETEIETKRRELVYLTLTWFMPTLIERTDRMSMYKNITVRIPYADYRIVEFLWNLPWEIKCNKTPKSLLREAFADLLPEEVINRKKSPFPKTYNPLYEEMLIKEFKKILENENSPILNIINKEKALDLLEQPKNYTKPWFGQLMAAPQLIAFYIQTNYWLEKYNIKFEL